jgi:hypothetical protein
MTQYPPQASDRNALALLLWRGLLRWEHGRLVHHPELSQVRAEDHTARSWTAAEDKKLARLVRQGKKPSAISVIIGRSYHLTKSRIAHLNLPLTEKQRSGPHVFHLSKRPFAEVQSAVKSSGTWVEAARKLNSTTTTVMKWGKRNGITPEAPRINPRRGPLKATKQRNANIIRAWRRGAPALRLAKRYNLTRQRIYKIIKPARLV